MASFVSANLSHELSGKFVTFTVDAKVHFEEQEVGHRWLFQIELMEEDPLADDKVAMAREHIFAKGDAIKRHYIVPSKQDIEVSFTEEVAQHLVDTEIGKEEIYANLHIIPTEAPEGFVASKTRTNTTIVDV